MASSAIRIIHRCHWRRVEREDVPIAACAKCLYLGLLGWSSLTPLQTPVWLSPKQQGVPRAAVWHIAAGRGGKANDTL